MTRLGSTTLAATLILSLQPGASWAQDRDHQVPEDVRAEGRRLHDEALAHVEAEQWALAAEAYQRVYDLARQHGVARAPVALWDRGLALMRIPGREREAREAFQRFLDESTSLADDDEIRGWRSTALDHIAELDARRGGSTPTDPSSELATPQGQEASTARSERVESISPIGPIVLGVGGATLIAGLIIAAVGLVQNQEHINDCPALVGCADTAPPPAAVAETRNLGLAGDVLWIAGAGITVIGFVLTLTLHDRQAEDGDGSNDSARVELQGLLGGGAMTLTGSFQ